MSTLLAMLHNINRGKNDKPAIATDYNPYSPKSTRASQEPPLARKIWIDKLMAKYGGEKQPPL